jgi:hypothetical protein
MFFRAIGLMIGPTGKTVYLVAPVPHLMIRPTAGESRKIEVFLVRPYGRLLVIRLPLFPA